MENYKSNLIEKESANEFEFNAGQILNAHLDEKFFPLQTIQSMAERWGRRKQFVYRKYRTDLEFPKPVEGIITETAMTPKLFAMHDVERYEKLRGYKHEEG